MRRLKRFFYRIQAFFGIRRRIRPEDIPDILDKETLGRVLAEARGLRRHQVDVQALGPGEEPGPPTPAAGDMPPGFG